jgi:hypothetical protein
MGQNPLDSKRSVEASRAWMTSTASFEKSNDPAFGQTPEPGGRTTVARQRQSEPCKLLHLIPRTWKAYLWSLGLLPYVAPREAIFLLQDFDRATTNESVEALQCLSAKSSVPMQLTLNPGTFQR